ncbi:MAG TPA: pitrilysin family protein, partial [Gemmatimonadaceae bacterium]|nr:pitrilysin family protein [Gemmatimonadaceae bacterium]
MKHSGTVSALSILSLLALQSVATAQGTFDRSKPPELGPPPKVSLPPIVTRQLPNGLKLMIVEQHELPLADFVLLVGSGSTADPANKPGIANLLSATLREGTTTRKSLEIADQIAFLGIRLSPTGSWESSTLSLHTPTAQLDSALALFADVALRPSFPANEFERVRKTQLTELLQLRDQGAAIASIAFPAIIYGSAHPYGAPAQGTEASVKALTTGDLQSYYQANFRPNNATLIVVGDVTPAQVEQKINTLFGGWQRADIPQINYSEPPKSGTTTIYLIDKPGAAQSSFRIGAVGVPRSTQDYFALTVMNTILGGSFTSRLNQNLRETRGYTYGAGSRFDMRRAAGPFLASAEIVTAKSDSALLEFMKELNGIRQLVPPAELSRAKRYLQLQLPGNFETTQQIGAALVPVALYGLPLDYYNNYVQSIEGVTQADVARVAQQYINPGSLAVVIVGDRKTIEAGLKATNVGPIAIRDISGQPIQ